jgi:tRNA nucleotidyltransferase (CCA-adding enzyme)
MRTYAVGGCVRDQLLGVPVADRDWVVVGATPEEMIAAGFRPVGKDFPVFLHPQTHEEYALARAERKTAPGYHGFVFHAAPDVTLEQALARRDLTINAMALDEAGRLVDPFGGRADLQAKVLRHVGPAFAEDPVRILRVARFLARYEPLGFSIAPETLARMRAMVAAGEADALVPERTWQETAKALAEPAPQAWLRALRECGALARIFPELDALYGVPQPEKWHPEIDTGLHMELVMQAAAALTPEPRIRFAALMHDLGKGRTPRSRWPRHIGHEESGARMVTAVCERLRVPTDYRELAVLAARWHGLVHRALELRPRTILDLLESCDAFRRPERFRELLIACEADHRGRGGLALEPYPQADRLRAAQAAAAAVVLGEADREGLSGEKIGELLRRRRLAALKSALAG